MSQLLAAVSVPPVPGTAVLPASGSKAEDKRALTLPVEGLEASESGASSGQQSASKASSPTSPALPLPADLLTALNMKAQRLSQDGGETEQQAEKTEELVLGPGPKEVLLEKFKKDPTGVLNLLQSAVSIDKLTGLLKDEHRRNEQLLLQLQNRLEAAYHTLRESEEIKIELKTKIADTNYKIGDKRKNLEDLRRELKILGDEEMKLKRRRDQSQGKYSELKRKLNSSTEALAQMETISKSLMIPTEISEPDKSPGKSPGPTDRADDETTMKLSANDEPLDADLAAAQTDENVGSVPTGEESALVDDGAVPATLEDSSSPSGDQCNTGLTPDEDVPFAESSERATGSEVDAAGEGEHIPPTGDVIQDDTMQSEDAVKVSPAIESPGREEEAAVQQDNLPLEGEGDDSAMEIADQLGIGNQGIMTMDQEGNMSKALPFSDAPFGEN